MNLLDDAIVYIILNDKNDRHEGAADAVDRAREDINYMSNAELLVLISFLLGQEKKS